MTDEHTGERAGDERVQPEQPDDMAEADIANGEGPDEAVREPGAGRSRTADDHPTGERRAAENRADDPPA